ncbi:SAM-dependent methyltransferase [Streptomyces sp. NPDC004629]|uniref:SAM-dependent methyltransferase n=1 Tax=Streptomyces sp. NPDC004629 TaxID=3364705 RepID=UPI00368D55F0
MLELSRLDIRTGIPTSPNLPFFDGLDLAAPGPLQVHRRRPDAARDPVADDRDIALYGAVARKP